EDYERLVADLLSRHPIDEAMSLAVGGDYDRIGGIELAILKHAGLRNDMALIDLGCGSGRLATALGQDGLAIDYLGVDIVQALLDYAKARTPSNYRFVLHRRLDLPADAETADIICAFSVFTHLLHTESFLYLQDIHRVLKPNGTLVFSFLEFAEPAHWSIFEQTLEAQRLSSIPHLNMFIERNAIDVWCNRLGFRQEAIVGAAFPCWGGQALGQSVAILRKI
ncbi:MAG: class I SAM-dependent methyltransferase, partial [Rhodospirillales bacterium]